MATPSTTLAQTVRLVDMYRQAALQAGRQPQVVLMRDAWVATSRAGAEAIYGPEVMTAYRYYWENRLAEFRDAYARTLEENDAEQYVYEFNRSVVERWRALALTIEES